MLFDKIIRLGYIYDHSNDQGHSPNSMRSSYVIVSQQCNVYPLHYSGNDASVGSDFPT